MAKKDKKSKQPNYSGSRPRQPTTVAQGLQKPSQPKSNRSPGNIIRDIIRG